jgi:sec-independent protein translocase protein TatB
LNIFGIGWMEIFMIAGIALLILGPAKTANMARTAGKMIGDVRRAFFDLSSAIEDEERDTRRGPQRNGTPDSKAGDSPEDRWKR